MKNNKEQLSMYVAPQDYILDAIKDPENLKFETDIIGDIEDFDTLESTVFNKFTIKASPVEQAVFTGESKKNENNSEYLKWNDMEVGKTYRSLDHHYGWMLGNVEDFELSKDQLAEMEVDGWIINGEVWVPDYEPFVLKSKEEYGGDAIYFPSINVTFDGLVGDEGEMDYEEVVESTKEALAVAPTEVKPKTKKNDTPYYIVQVLGTKDGKWKTVCKSTDDIYAYEIYDRWYARLQSGEVDVITDISFTNPGEMMYEALEITEEDLCKRCRRYTGGKLRDDYYVECDESKNERGGSDYGSFYNMLADRLQEEGYEGLKKIAWYCALGTEFSGIANAIHEFRDEDFKLINKRAYKIFDAIDSMVVPYWDSIQGAALYFDSLGKQDNRFNNMLTDMLEDYSLGSPNIGSPNSIIDLVDDIVAELPKAIELANKGLNALYRTIDSITAPQGAIGTKKAIKVQLKATLDKEIVKANRIVALLKQEWPNGIQPQKDVFKGPEDVNKLEYEIHAILGEEMYSNTLSDDFGSFFIEDANDSANGICVNFYFGQPEGKVRVIAFANPEQYGNDYTQEAVYKLPIDVNELAQNAIYLHDEAMKELEKDKENE